MNFHHPHRRLWAAFEMFLIRRKKQIVLSGKDYFTSLERYLKFGPKRTPDGSKSSDDVLADLSKSVQELRSLIITTQKARTSSNAPFFIPTLIGVATVLITWSIHQDDQLQRARNQLSVSEKALVGIATSRAQWIYDLAEATGHEDIPATIQTLVVFVHEFSQWKGGADSAEKDTRGDVILAIRTLGDLHALEPANRALVDLRNLNLQKASLDRANLAGCNLWQSHIESSNLWGVNLRGSFLSEAHLENADLRRADLTGAVLWDAHLEGANLEGAEVTPEQLAVAFVDNRTQKPNYRYSYFHPPTSKKPYEAYKNALVRFWSRIWRRLY